MMIVHLISLALVLRINCGQHLEGTYSKTEVTDVAIFWDESKSGFHIEPVQHTGWYSFYEDVQYQSYYAKLPDVGDVHLTVDGFTREVYLLFAPHFKDIVCIGKRDDNGEMIRTKPKIDRSHGYEGEIVKVLCIVFGILFCACCACFAGSWFICSRRNKNSSVQYLGQPQQFQVYQQPMPVFNQHPMTMQTQEGMRQ